MKKIYFLIIPLLVSIVTEKTFAQQTSGPIVYKYIKPDPQKCIDSFKITKSGSIKFAKPLSLANVKTKTTDSGNPIYTGFAIGKELQAFCLIHLDQEKLKSLLNINQRMAKIQSEVFETNVLIALFVSNDGQLKIDFRYPKVKENDETLDIEKGIAEIVSQIEPISVTTIPDTVIVGKRN